jgi:hypothetical protein
MEVVEDVEGRPFDEGEIDGRGKPTSRKEESIRATENFSRRLASRRSGVGSVQKRIVGGAGRRVVCSNEGPVQCSRILN